MTGPRAEYQIERYAKSRRDKSCPLQDAERTRQIAEPKLVGEGEHQHRVDRYEPEGIEQPRPLAVTRSLA